VPATVVDRCHRFDFQRPSVEQIATVVARTRDRRGIDDRPEAVAVLARHASGSFRDALGTLEQLQTYAGGEIALADVLAVLGISDAELLFEAFDAIAAADPRRALAAASARRGQRPRPGGVHPRARDPRARAADRADAGRRGPGSELSLTPERDERLAAGGRGLDSGALVRTLDLLAAALTHLRAGADARTQLELALVKAARADLDPSLAALTARIEQLERVRRPRLLRRPRRTPTRRITRPPRSNPPPRARARARPRA
jgi:DNA polymerase III subunit gamma/tau